MNLQEAQQVAAQLADQMRPFCERIEVAGSIRRECPEVKDVEIVAIPRWQNASSPVVDLLFEDVSAPVPVNLLYEWAVKQSVVQWIKPGVPGAVAWHVNPAGKYWRGLTNFAEGSRDIKLDLFLTRPENWGVIYCIRTGSADFSRALVTHARDKTPYRVQEGELRDAQGLVPCAEESYLFSALGLEWIDPRARGGDRDLVVLD